MQAKGLAARAGSWSARHRKTAIFGWIAFVLVAVFIGGSIGTKEIDESKSGVGESRLADQAIADNFRDVSGESVIVQSRDGKLTARDAAFKDGVAQVVAQVQRFDAAERIQSPLDKSGAGLISKDGRSALVQFEVAGEAADAEKKVAPIQAAVKQVQAGHPDLRIEQFGGASSSAAIDRQIADDFKRAEFTSIPVTLIILVLAFGALVAAGLPLLLALSSVAAALGLVGVLSHLLPVDQSVAQVVLLVGMAVGIDYALFYIRRIREEKAKGRGRLDAIDVAAATSGRAVLVSGLTVMLAMGGMFLSGDSTFTSFAMGTIIVVAVAMIGSLTVLPAMLSALGPKLDKGRVPFVGRLARRTGAGEGRMWGAIISRVMRRPLVSAAAATAFLVALTIPALGLHTVNAGVDGLPRSIPVMQTYDRIQEAFPGGEMPATVAVQAQDVTSPAVAKAIVDMKSKALATGKMSDPVDIQVSENKHVAVVAIPLQGSGTDAASDAALAALRDGVIPATVGKVDGAEANVTGMTAGSKDFNDQMKSHLPLVFAFVLGTAFLLLLITFRSIVIPIKAIVLNLLSVGAAYGVLVLVFQGEWAEGLLGFESNGGIAAWLPMFLFVLLFGLSMDYHVLILSRIKELYDGGMSTDKAVAKGITATAGVVTSAAIVMVAVFAIFATLSMVEMKQMGIGLAVAILIDATIVRAVLLPATMKLLGRWNWWLPRSLRWLPKVRVEQPEPARA